MYMQEQKKKMMNNNKLIAEFMELPTEVSKAGLLNYYHKEYNSGTWYEEHELSYNVSWDWLMPVVEKIFSLGYHYEIKPRYMMIKERLSSEVVVFESNFKGQNKSQIEIIYNAVIEFIESYE